MAQTITMSSICTCPSSPVVPPQVVLAPHARVTPDEARPFSWCSTSPSVRDFFQCNPEKKTHNASFVAFVILPHQSHHASPALSMTKYGSLVSCNDIAICLAPLCWSQIIEHLVRYVYCSHIQLVVGIVIFRYRIHCSTCSCSVHAEMTKQYHAGCA